jgi:hypothetical protein
MVRLFVPTLNDSLNDFNVLFSLLKQVEGWGLNITFDFSHCGFLRQNAVAFLGGIARLVADRRGTVNFDLQTLKPGVRKNLTRNGFLAAFNYDEQTWAGTTIPYREDLLESENIAEYLSSMWLGRGWVQISGALKAAIVGRVWETYANAFEHGNSNIGVQSCGQFYPNLGVLKLTVVDFGVGVPTNVRKFLKQPLLADNVALEWAFHAGNSTAAMGIGRGIGLDLLKTFIQKNRGSLEILSHNAYGIMNVDKESYESQPTYFGGTLINITLVCDESYYDLTS